MSSVHGAHIPTSPSFLFRSDSPIIPFSPSEFIETVSNGNGFDGSPRGSSPYLDLGDDDDFWSTLNSDDGFMFGSPLRLDDDASEMEKAREASKPVLSSSSATRTESPRANTKDSVHPFHVISSRIQGEAGTKVHPPRRNRLLSDLNMVAAFREGLKRTHPSNEPHASAATSSSSLPHSPSRQEPPLKRARQSGSPPIQPHPLLSAMVNGCGNAPVFIHHRRQHIQLCAPCRNANPDLATFYPLQECERCKRCFATESHLRDHQVMEHRDGKCPKCGSQFEVMQGFKQHRRKCLPSGYNCEWYKRVDWT